MISDRQSKNYRHSNRRCCSDQTETQAASDAPEGEVETSLCQMLDQTSIIRILKKKKAAKKIACYGSEIGGVE